MRKKSPPRSEWTTEEFVAIVAEIEAETENGSDRGTVLVGAAVVDNCLRRILFVAMPDSDAANELLADDGRAPLGTFSARTLAARAMGLISAEEQSCINTIRKIRNIYAHEFGHAIDQNSIDDMCRDLEVRADRLSGAENGPPGRATKIVFASAVMSLLLVLLPKAHPEEAASDLEAPTASKD